MPGARLPPASRAGLLLEIPRATELRQQFATRLSRAQSLLGVVVVSGAPPKVLAQRMRQTSG